MGTVNFHRETFTRVNAMLYEIQNQNLESVFLKIRHLTRMQIQLPIRKVSISRIAKATRCSNKCATYTYTQRTRRVDVAQPRLLGICVEVRSHNRVQHSRTVLDAKTKAETNDKIGRQRGDRDKVTEVNKHGERSRRTG